MSENEEILKKDIEEEIVSLEDPIDLAELKERIVDAGYEDVLLFKNYVSAFVGISEDNRAIYNYDLMVEYLLIEEQYESIEEAIEWIEYNTIRSLPYAGEGAPIIMYPLDSEY